MKYLIVSLFLIVTLLATLALSQEECDFSSDCDPKLQCIARECLDPCIKKCHPDENCHVDEYHEPHCTNIQKFCTANSECLYDEKCNLKSGKCSSVCESNCNVGEICEAKNHYARCYRIK